MTGRTSPVGVVFLAAAGLFTVGCTSQTAAVFEALLDPVTAPASPSGADGVEAETTPGPTWWPHPDGSYALGLPGDWSGTALAGTHSAQLLDAIGADHPGLAARSLDVLDRTGSSVSMIAADRSSTLDAWSVLLVVSQPRDGRKKRVVRAHTYDHISQLPGLRGTIIRDDVRLPNHRDSVRYDYTIDDEDVGALRVRSYLFRFGGTAYLVSFVANESAFDAAEADFDAIVESIRFGY